jgi:four helix bundle protein
LPDVSVPTNIVEGSARRNRNEFKQFLNIAIGSLAETEYLLELSMKLEYLSQTEYDTIETIRHETGAMLFKLHQAFT